jgi:hypothetical protein
MIFLYFTKRNIERPDREKYSRIVAQIIPILIHQNKIMSSLTKNINIETKIILK